MIHAPWSRIHLVMYLITAGLGLTLLALWIALLAAPAETRRSDVVLGFMAISGIGIGGLVVYWVAYLGNQRSADLRGGQLHVRSWLRVGPFGTDRSFKLADVQSALLLRPHHVEFTIAGASTRVGTVYTTLRDVDRFGTFWWTDEDYRALERQLREAGVAVTYRHAPGFGTLLSAR